MIHKKGESNTLSVIVIAVLLLVVLIVLISIFTGRVGDFNKDVGSCALRGGLCQAEACVADAVKLERVTCVDEKQNCCIKIPGK